MSTVKPIIFLQHKSTTSDSIGIFHDIPQHCQIYRNWFIL